MVPVLITKLPSGFKKNVLIAYPYIGKSKNIVNELMSWNKDEYRLMIDSGAFTAWKSGNPIKIDDYCRFLDSIERLRPFYAIQLDSVGNHDETERNLRIMLSRGYDVLPVFTRGAPLDWLDECYRLSDYTLFGGIVEGSGNQKYVQWFMEHAKGRRCHWLGFDNKKYVVHYKPYSLDSSSWESASRFGALFTYTGGNSFTGFSKKDAVKELPLIRRHLNHMRVPEHWGRMLLSDHETAWKNLSTVSVETHNVAAKITGWSYMLRAMDMQAKIGTIGYMALTDKKKLQIIDLVYKELKKQWEIK